MKKREGRGKKGKEGRGTMLEVEEKSNNGGGGGGGERFQRDGGGKEHGRGVKGKREEWRRYKRKDYSRASHRSRE